MALPGPGAAVRAARLRGRLQADHPGAALVPDPAAADHHHLHGHLRPDRQPAHRWAAAVPVLHVRDGGVGLFCGLPEQDLQYLRGERQPVWQGVFPAHGGAGLDPDLEPDHLRNSVYAVYRVCVFLCAARHAHPAPLDLDCALAAAGADDGGTGFGLRDYHLLVDHQVPRPAFPGDLRGAIADVCHAGHLPGLVHPAALPVGHIGESDDAHCGGLPLCLPGRRRDPAGVFVVQFRLHASGRLPGQRDFQPGGADIYGYSIIFIDMKNIQPQQPSHLSPYARACLDALVRAGLADRISLGGALGLFHYLDYRPTHDVDAWWSESVTENQKQAVLHTLETTLSPFGNVRVRAWGDVESMELAQDGKTVFSFQIARRSVRLEESVSAGWIDVPLDSLVDLAASKMVALVERGAPRDFLDIFSVCQAGLFNIAECWALWRRRQALTGSDVDAVRARLAIETHLERIALHRPLEQIAGLEQREQARQLRDWFLSEFLQVKGLS